MATVRRISTSSLTFPPRDRLCCRCDWQPSLLPKPEDLAAGRLKLHTIYDSRRRFLLRLFCCTLHSPFLVFVLTFFPSTVRVSGSLYAFCSALYIYRIIHHEDPNAFVTMSNVEGVFGEGFDNCLPQREQIFSEWC